MKRTLLAAIFAAIFKAVLKAATPILRQAISDFLDRLEEKAKQTASPYDDVLVEMLKDLLTDDDE